MSDTPLRILVLDTDNIGRDLDWSALAALGKLSLMDALDGTEVVPIVARIRPHVLVANRPLLGASIFAPPLQLVCLTATGTNTVDIEAARRAGIGVCNIRGYSTESVAQHTFALALGLTNRLRDFEAHVANWSVKTPDSASAASSAPRWTDLSLGFCELSGKAWGIIGMGAIGRRVAELASAFGCRVCWASAHSSAREEAWPQKKLEELLTESDIVSIHSPLTDASRNLIRTQELSLMKPGSILINVGRGGIVVESDLARALTMRTIAGAALDVLLSEPPEAENPLLNLPPGSAPLILTPHVAWAAIESRQRAVDETVANIVSWTRGEQRNRVD